MPLAFYQYLPFALLLLPFAETLALGAIWWSGLARPWLFIVLGSVALYGFAAALIFVTDHLVIFGGYFLESVHQRSEQQIASQTSSMAWILWIALPLLSFVVISAFILLGIKLWLSRP